MSALSRSAKTFSTSWSLLMKDKELLVLPLIAGVLILGTVFLFGFATGLVGGKDQDSTLVAVMGAFTYLILNFIAIFFQAAIVYGAAERLQGGDPTIGSALGGALKQVHKLFMWAIVTSIVGAILRAIEKDNGLVGRIVSGIIGFAWSLGTIFVIPVLVLENLGFGASFKRSWGLFKGTWGESAVGNLGFGLISFLVMLLIGALTALVATAFNSPLGAFIFAAVGISAMMVVLSALQGIFITALYRYATTRETPDGFDKERIASTFN